MPGSARNRLCHFLTSALDVAISVDAAITGIRASFSLTTCGKERSSHHDELSHDRHSREDHADERHCFQKLHRFLSSNVKRHCRVILLSQLLLGN